MTGFHGKLFDPCGGHKYNYTLERRCEEDAALNVSDGSHTIYLSTCGENADEVPEELVKFLAYVKADLRESDADFSDDFVKKLQESVRHIKASRDFEFSIEASFAENVVQNA